MFIGAFMNIFTLLWETLSSFYMYHLNSRTVFLSSFGSKVINATFMLAAWLLHL